MGQSHKSVTLKRWTLFTTFGWIIGILLVLGFAALSEVILRTQGDSSGQAAVGIGMGTGVGFMQWWVIRKVPGFGQRWFWFYVLGFSVAYIAFDLVAANVVSSLKPEMGTPFATLLGALITGWLQYEFVLKKILVRAINWIVAITIGWFCAHVITASIMLANGKVGENVPRILLFILVLAFLTIGGPLLGYMTGRFLVPRIQQYQMNPSLPPTIVGNTLS